MGTGEKFLSDVEITPSGVPDSPQDAPTQDFTEAEGSVQPNWLTAVRAAGEKQAQNIVVLDLRGITSFTDYFVICHGNNAKQAQAIADEIETHVRQTNGERPMSVEGYSQADWILCDYGDFLVHVFTPKSREFYDLERLWRNAQTVAIPPAA